MPCCGNFVENRVHFAFAQIRRRTNLRPVWLAAERQNFFCSAGGGKFARRGAACRKFPLRPVSANEQAAQKNPPENPAEMRGVGDVAAK